MKTEMDYHPLERKDIERLTKLRFHANKIKSHNHTKTTNAGGDKCNE